MSTVFADYVDERSAFDELCCSDCDKPILFFEGESGSGKTKLLFDCKNRIPDDLIHIGFDCKSGTISVTDIFYRSVNKLGWELLPEFQHEVSTYSEHTTINLNIKDVKLKGDRSSIEIALRAEKEEDKRIRQSILTNAWFQDIKNFDNNLLIIIDTFEKATSVFKSWLDDSFLGHVSDTPQMRVLVAGQCIPDIKNIGWGDCCNHYPLLGIPDAKDWMPVVEELNRHIEVENPLNWLAGVCHAFKGRPEAIMKVIMNLPLKTDK